MTSGNYDILDREFFYDFRESRKWYKTFAGIGNLKETKPNYLLELYRIFAFLFLIQMTIMFLVTALITTDYLAEFAEAFHYSVVLLSMVLYFPIERLGKNDIEVTFQKLKKCFYSYNGELNEEQKEIKRKVIKEIKFFNSLFIWMLVCTCFVYIILTPLKDYLYPHLKLKRSEIINAKLPIPFYIPFEDSYGIAYIIVFIMECCGNIMIHSLITSIHEAYISITGLICGEMQLLNYSLKHLEQRALKMYLNKNAKEQYSNKNMYKSPVYQQCLANCLEEDLIHHRTLLSCIKLMRPFLGRVIISVFTLCSVLWAVGGCVMLKMLEQGTALDKVLEFCLILFAEWIYVFDMCLFNEKIKAESGELFNQIYSIHWYNCDRNFGQNIHFMLMSTRNPPQLNKNLFNVLASFETFLSLLSAAFSYINVLRSINK